MSPRRSSRARSSANPQPAPSQTGSSNSSTNLKNPRTAQRSESIEDTGTLVDDDASTEPIMPRRSRRNGAEDSREESQNARNEDRLEDEPEPLEDDPEEVTRCICGRLEYPGPTNAIAFIAEEKSGAVTDLVNKDTGDFFVQCDKCLVWQHGGCMGFHDEGNLPEEYYCELCKPKLHSIQRTPQGKRSRYVPPQQAPPQADSSRSSSLSASDARKKEKLALAESSKRRATMNSRGAYDEDEMLRRAIEESSKDSGTLGKRTRDDADDSKKAIKRQRTGSVSSESKGSASPPATDDGTTKTAGKSKQSLRGAAARNNKEREAREKAKEQQVAARAEAANKRNARSERRRGEDSPPPSPSVSPSKALAVSSQKAKDKADTPPVTSKPTAKSKNARTNNRGGRRVGRNQYTKDRDLNGNVDSDTPMRDTGDANGNTNGRNSPGHNNINGESGRSSKAKTHPARTSLNEMKRRVAAILEFVGQMQTQASRHSANGKGSDKSGSGSEKGTPALGAMSGVASLVKAVQAATEDIAASHAGDDRDGDLDVKGRLKLRDDSDFRDMGSAEMMEALTRELIAWQRVYGVYSR